MRLQVILFSLIIIRTVAIGQYSAKVTEGMSYADLDIRISDNIYSEDIGIEISENVYSEDFTIGFTNSKVNADLIITDNRITDFEVNIKSNYADISIEVSDNVYSEDIGIEIRKSGHVDYLIYSEITNMTLEKLIGAMLPIINLYLEEDDRLEDVPVYRSRNSMYKTSSSNNSGFVTPIIESSIDGEFNGWEGETVFKLTNGQTWKQSSYDYMYSYAYNPEVQIFETNDVYVMKVEDIDETIEVKRIK